MEKKEVKGSIHEKLLALQDEIVGVKKGAINPFFKSKYFDINALLETIKPVLSKYRMVILQPLSNIGGRPAIKTILTDVDSGESIIDICPLVDVPDPQKMGSAITYFRRYALQSLFGLQSLDDDANLASGKTAKKKEVKKDVGTQNIIEKIKKGHDLLSIKGVHRDRSMEKHLKTTKFADADYNSLCDYLAHLQEKWHEKGNG
ncbi:MAG: ERF family protein [Candidatus Scalindua sp.]|nr:ERF family protein [Candidatus Scalindua sp.]